jgi:ArsR family transcriptional regulator, virulence genes transcriptional regulator
MGDDLDKLAPKAAQAERFLKALASGARLMILCELHKGETSVTPLQQALGLSQSSLSQHLARLRADALVKTRRESQTIYYSLADEKVSRAIALIYELFCGDGGKDAKTPPSRLSSAGAAARRRAR